VRTTVRRIPLVLGSAVALLVTGTTAANATTAQAVFGYGAPAFEISAAPSSFANADFSGEPSIGVDWNTGAGLFQDNTSTLKLTFDNTTQPPGISWTDVSSTFSVENLDPILATDPTTGLTLAGGDDGPCAVMSATLDDGTTWTPSLPCAVAVDHPSVGVGPLTATPPTGTSAPEAAYFCQQEDVDVCTRSVDGGTTWTPGAPQTGCAGLFGHVKVSADGTVYVPQKNCSDPNGNLVVGGQISTDDGTTWGSYSIPGAAEPARGFDPSVATTPDNTVYEAWARAGDYHPVVASSSNHGATWTAPVDLANTVSPPLYASTFPAAVAGDNGRMAVAYLGTWAPGAGSTGTPFDSGFHGVWYLFVSYTYDGGQTWTTVQATPTPVQRGSISDGGTTSTGQRNLLDFMDASVTKDGRVAVAFANGCLASTGCAGPTGTETQSTDAYATVAYQASGRGLFSADDVNPVTAPAAPTLTATGGIGATSLAWTVPADGGSAITGYQLLRGSAPGAETSYQTLPATATSFTDTAVTAGTTYYYSVAAVNAVGTGTPSNEASAVATSVPGAPTLSATTQSAQVALSWSTPASGGTPITGYAISRGTASGAETPLQTLPASTTSYQDSAVTPGTTYYYTVAAVNADGTGASSNEVSALPQSVPGAPPTLTTTASRSLVTVSWSAPTNDGGSPVTGYELYRGTTAGGETPYQALGNTTSYADSAVANGTTYYYTVAAVNAIGTGPESREASATPLKKLKN